MNIPLLFFFRLDIFELFFFFFGCCFLVRDLSNTKFIYRIISSASRRPWLSTVERNTALKIEMILFFAQVEQGFDWQLQTKSHVTLKNEPISAHRGAKCRIGVGSRR